MDIPLGLELMSFWTGDEEAIENKEKFDIKIPKESITVKPVMLYSVDYVEPSQEKDVCYVFSGDTEFIINESYESVNAKIRNQIIYKLN